MDLTSPHPMQRYWDLASAGLQIKALEYAMASGLLFQLKTPSTPEALANKLHLVPNATSVLLELLWSMEVLRREPVEDSPSPETFRYALSPAASRYLLDESEQSCAQAWRFRMQTLNTCGQSLAAFIEGRLQDSDFAAVQPEQAWANAARTQIAQEQRAITAPAAVRLLQQQLNIPRTGHFLDLGGGPGFISIELAQHCPALTGTVFDLPATTDVAADNIREAGLQHRLNTRAGDAATDDLGGPYDLIWCSSVLHFLPKLDEMLQRLQAVLNPGGMLICAHAEISASPAEALQTLPFYLPLMLRGHYVPHQNELPSALARNGFVHLSAHRLQHSPMTPIWIHTGRKTT